MSSIKRMAKSPSLAVSIAVLIAAFGGSAAADVASTSLSKKDTKKVKKIAKKQAKKQVDKRFPVEGGDIADGAVSSGKIADGSVGAGDIAGGAVGPTQLSGAIPGVRVTHSQVVDIPISAATTLEFDTERYDTANMHSNSNNNSRLTAPRDGLYLASANVSWEPTERS